MTGARRLGPADLPAALALQARATDGLAPGFVIAKDAAALAPYLDGSRGAAFGIGGARLDALALLRLPTAAHPNPVGPVAFPIVPAAEWPLAVATFENAMVDPGARGRGLQRVLIAARLDAARAAGMRWAAAGIRLANVASWRNAIAGGFAAVGVRPDPGQPIFGLLRALDGGAALATDPRDRLAVAFDDAGGHAAACADGRIGVRLVDHDRALVYERPCAMPAAIPLPRT